MAANTSNPNQFSKRGHRLFCQQQATVTAGATGELTPPINLEAEHARVLYGIVTDGVLTDVNLIVTEEGVTITPDDGVPLTVFADSTPPEVQLRRADLMIFPGKDFKPKIKNAGTVTDTWTIVWVLEKVASFGAGASK